MKYNNIETKYSINIQYEKIKNMPYNKNNRTLWTIFSVDNKYLPLADCVFCSLNVSNRLTTYNNYYNSFILSSVWLYNIINKYNIQECLIIGNRMHFLESLLYYKTDKVGFMPLHIDKGYSERFNCEFTNIKNTYPNKIKIESNESKTKYTNIIFYISLNIFGKDTNDIRIYNKIIHNLLNVLIKLKEGGNMIYRIIYSDNDVELNEFNIQLIYILSTCFEGIEYTHEEYSAESFYLKNICIFYNYKNNYSIINDICNKIIKINNNIDILKKFIDIEYDDKFVNFIKQLNNKLNVYSENLIKNYEINKEIIDISFKNNIDTKFYDDLYKLNFMKNLEISINICKNANIEVDSKYKKLNIIFKNKMEKKILRKPKLECYDLNYINNKMSNYYHTHNEKYTITKANYELMRLYISLRDKNKIKNILKKISVIDNLSQYNFSLKFMKIYEIISNFKLIDTKSKIRTLHVCEYNTDAILAINHYYKKYNKTNEELSWKVYLLNDNNTIDKHHLLFESTDNYDINKDNNLEYIKNNYQNIDICTFDITIYEKYLLIPQVFICINTLKQGGNAIFKIYINDIDEIIIKYLNLLKTYFENIYFIKSSIDIYESKEIYIVAKNKNKVLNENYFYKQIEYINDYNDIYDINMCDLNFLLLRPINKILTQEIHIIFVILYYYDNTELLETILKKFNKKNFIQKWIKEYSYN